jgi:signal transduction histidine kinase
MQHAAWQHEVERALHDGPGHEALALSEQADRDAARTLVGASLVLHFYQRALLLARAVRDRGALARIKATRALEACVQRLAVHARECPQNFAAWHLLAAAEQARVRGDEGAAIRGYAEAADRAAEHGLVQDEALACMTAAHFYSAAGLDEPARAYLTRARRAYLRWGANGRVAALDREHPGLERGDPAAVAPSAASVAPSGTLVQSPNALDFASLFKAAQVFAEEYRLDRLLDTIMAIVVENSAAERGVLLLDHGEGLTVARGLHISAAASVDLGAVPLASFPDLPHRLVHYVQRTARAVAVPDLALDPRFADDPHVRQARTRSALCVPLHHQGQRIGALYLENNLHADVFDERRIAAINLLAVQAAIAIERTSFYARLDAAKQAAEAASLAKTRFLANMSHELRTPLNAILGYGELLAEEAEARGLIDMLGDCNRIRHAGTHLLGLISDILDLTKIEADRLELERAPIVLSAFVAEIAELLRPELARGSQRLLVDCPAELGSMIGDPIRIRQVLLNLLSNAVKFGARPDGTGTITLGVRCDDGRVRFRVADDGPGLRGQQQATIFEPFTQLDASATRRRDGAGLGLTICRSLCERMDGAITVENNAGAGSTFTVDLPLRPRG